jgi:hypothetical protein
MAHAGSDTKAIEWHGFLKRLRQPEWLFLATVVFTVAISGFCAFLLQRGSDNGGVIRLVLPPEYRGLFVIECDCADGMPEERNGNIVTYVIPNTGRLRIQNCSVFSRPHKLRAETHSGHVFPTDTDDSVGLAGDEVRLWELWSTAAGSKSESHATQVFFVGTRLEYEDIRSSRDDPYGNNSPARTNSSN